MWKVIVLSAFLIASQATNIETFYGEWLWSAFYPDLTHKAICLYFSFSEYTGNDQCTCSDGKNTSLIQMSIKKHAEYEGFGPKTVPILIVDSPDEVAAALNVDCRCGDKQLSDRTVLRSVNKDFFIMYEKMRRFMANAEREPNKLNIYSRNIPTLEELNYVTASLKELEGRQRSTICTTEV